MNILKNSEVAKKYGVHISTVANYIKGAEEGQNSLKLVKIGEKIHIANSTHNTIALEKLALNTKKYKSSADIKKIEPNSIFYKIFTYEQITDIITSLETRSEIPMKFIYVDKGVKIWQKYVENFYEEEVSNSTKNDDILLSYEYKYLVNYLEPNYKFNIFDIGVGDATPVKSILEKLEQDKLINSYTGLDFSSEMCNLAINNLKKWFGEKFSTQVRIMDILTDDFKTLLFEKKSKQLEQSQNLVLFLGGTIENFGELDVERALLNISNSLGKNDIFVLGRSIDSKEAVGQLNLDADFSSKKTPNKIPELSTWILETMGIDKSYYTSNIYFDEVDRCRKIEIIPVNDIEVKFNFHNLEKSIILEKAKPVIIYRHKHQSFLLNCQQINRLGFEILSSTKSLDNSRILFVCKLRD